MINNSWASASAHRAFIALAVLSLCLVSGALPGAAQTSNASIVGTVTDASGAAIPGATVTVTSLERGIEVTVESSEIGAYRVYPLNPGTYSVTASTEGFQTLVQPEVTLQTQAQDIKTPGADTELHIPGVGTVTIRVWKSSKRGKVKLGVIAPESILVERVEDHTWRVNR